MLPHISFSSLLVYLPLSMMWVGFVITVFLFLRRGVLRAPSFWKLFWVFLVLRISYALILSLLQYGAWQSNPFSQYLLPPHQSLSYFLSYSGMHFWLYPALTLIVVILTLSFFHIMSRINVDRLLDEEVALSVLLTLLLGWPLSLFFIPISFFIAAMFSLHSLITKRGEYVSLGGIMLVVGGLLMLFGVFGIHFLHLEALYV